VTELLGYARERLPLVRFGPLALLLVLLGGGFEPERLVNVGPAFVLIAVFRLRDDLGDRRRDARLHPDRVLVRAGSIEPFERAVVIGLALALLLLALVHGLDRALLLAALAGAFELAYRFDLPARHRWVLLKYPAFVALLGEVSLAGAALIYLGFAIFERADDPDLRRRSDADARLVAYLLGFAALAGFVLGPASLAWLAGFVGVWAFASTRALAGRGQAIFLVLLLVWSHGAIGDTHARDPRLSLLR
jgi:hypothetical protein